MNAPRSGRWLITTLGFVFLLSPCAVHSQESAARLLLERAMAAIDSTEVERGVDLLRRAYAALPERAPIDLRTRILVNLAAVHVSLGNQEDAFQTFRRVLAIEPFYAVDTVRFNPLVHRALVEARRGLLAGTLTLPADTTIAAATGVMEASLRVTTPVYVRIALVRTGAGGREAAMDSGFVQERLSVRFPARHPGGGYLPSGDYELVAWGFDSAQSRHRLATRRLRLTLRQQDTLPQEQPLPDSAFRPERRTGTAGHAALVRGVLLGGLTASLPYFARRAELTSVRAGDGRAIAVGSTLAVSGFVAFMWLRPGRAIASNIRYNERLRTAWRERNTAIARENSARQAATTLRVEDLGDAWEQP